MNAKAKTNQKEIVLKVVTDEFNRVLGFVKVSKKTTEINFARNISADGTPVGRCLVKVSAAKNKINSYYAYCDLHNEQPEFLNFYPETNNQVEFISFK